uniref:Uncharacterized protein n=1 Tax=Anopheles melas TaxID=34690 RepID=A0A182U347_9DIPT
MLIQYLLRLLRHVDQRGAFVEDDEDVPRVAAALHDPVVVVRLHDRLVHHARPVAAHVVQQVDDQRVALAFALLGHVGGARLLRLCQLVEHRTVKVLVQRVQIGRVDAAPHDLVAVQEDAVLDRRERGLDHVDKVLHPQKEQLVQRQVLYAAERIHHVTPFHLQVQYVALVERFQPADQVRLRVQLLVRPQVVLEGAVKHAKHAIGLAQHGLVDGVVYRVAMSPESRVFRSNGTLSVMIIQ